MERTCEDVIRTKLSAPALPPELVARPRLVARLEESTGRVVLVSAAAGCGKTSLVLEWLATRRAPAAWLSVDPYDNDPTRFFRHLSAAVRGLGVHGAEVLATLLETLGQRSGGGAELQDALAGVPDDTVLVLDDVHVLEAPSVLRGVQALLEPRRFGPRIVLLTRIDPPLPLGRLRVSGDLVEIRERELRFTREECDALFAAALPGGLAPAHVALLEARTEGWAAGLRMAAIALRDAGDRDAAIAAFAGTHRIVVDYLLEEAFETQPAEVQRFLLDTSVLERFTAETCAAVTQDSQAALRLAQVEAASLFLVPLGAGRTWYRYHHLFRELLEFRARRTQPERLERLHARASAWFEEAGDVDAAIEHACRMADRGRLCALLDAHAMRIIGRSELTTYGRWVQHVPAALEQPFPNLILGIGWLRVLLERAPDLRDVLAAAESALAGAGPAYDEARCARARAHILVLRGFAARFAGQFHEAMVLSRRVRAELPPEDSFLRGLATYNEARLHMHAAAMHPAAELLAAAQEDNLRAGNSYLVLTGLGQGASVSAQTEGVYRARERLAAAAVFAEERHLTGLPAYSAVLYHRGLVEYLADGLEDAEAACTHALDLAGPDNFPEGRANALLALARIAGARRDFGRAQTLLTELAAFAQTRNVVLFDTIVELEQLRLALWREQRGAGPPLAPLQAPAADAAWSLLQETRLVLVLAQLLRSGEPGPSAAALAQRLALESEPRGRGVALCIARAALALAQENGDRRERLEQALALAAVRGYVRPLLELGEPLRPLIETATGRGFSPAVRGHARLLLERLDAGSAAAAPAALPALPEPLTAREQQVLLCLARDLSNKAMARELFVSAETVKTHLKHLYWKLGATSRGEAVARARELGLAPLGR